MIVVVDKDKCACMSMSYEWSRDYPTRHGISTNVLVRCEAGSSGVWMCAYLMTGVLVVDTGREMELWKGTSEFGLVLVVDKV